MIEYYIHGTDDTGRCYDREHGMTTMCLQHVADAYIKKFPRVVHLCIDVALPTTKDARQYNEGRFG